MRNALIIWEFDNPHDNVLRRFRQVLREADQVTLLGYSGDGAHADPEQLRAAVAETLPEGIDLQETILCSPGSLEAEIRNQVENESFEVVIKSHSPEESGFHADIDSHLLRDMRLPLIICANHKRKTNNVVLATVDVSGDDEFQDKINRQVLGTAAQYASTMHKQLHMIYVIPVNRADHVLEISDPMNLVRKYGDEAQARMQSLSRELNLEGISYHITAGLPEDEIKSIAKEAGADLVVMGSVGRKGLKGLLLGSTAERMIKNLRRDLLIIRPEKN